MTVSSLTLGVHGLPAGEAGLVRALLSLAGSGDAGWRWTFVSTGPCDVLLADAPPEAARQAQAERRARALVLLGSEAPDHPATALARPLRASELEATLRRLGDNLPPVANAQPLTAPVAAAETGIDAGQPRYKLLRWPPAELLRGEAHRIRMASQLSRRFLSASELAGLTNQDPARSLMFLQLLQGFRLLEVESAGATPASTATTSTPRPAGGWALVRSIRRKLGL